MYHRDRKSVHFSQPRWCSASTLFSCQIYTEISTAGPEHDQSRKWNVTKPITWVNYNRYRGRWSIANPINLLADFSPPATLHLTEAEIKSFLHRGDTYVSIRSLFPVIQSADFSRQLCDEGDWIAEAFDPDMARGMMVSLQNCRIFLIRDSFIGIAPEATLTSDVLCILKGSFAPCLLRQRPNGGWWLISGDCYARSLQGEHPINTVTRYGLESWDNLQNVLGDPEEFAIY